MLQYIPVKLIHANPLLAHTSRQLWLVALVEQRAINILVLNMIYVYTTCVGLPDRPSVTLSVCVRRSKEILQFPRQSKHIRFVCWKRLYIQYLPHDGCCSCLFRAFDSKFSGCGGQEHDFSSRAPSEQQVSCV